MSSQLSRRHALQLGGGLIATVPALNAFAQPAEPSRRGRIDTHFHLLTPGVHRWAEGAGLYDPSDPPSWVVSDLDLALKVMADNGIEVGVISYPVPSYAFSSEAQTIEGVEVMNSEAAALVRRHPRRFGFFAHVALAYPELAVSQAIHALDALGADGVILMTNAGGNYLGHPSFDPLFAELDKRRAVIFTHPQGLPGGPSGGLANTSVLDFLFETTQMAVNLVANHTRRRFPNVRVILSHGGGFLPYAAERIKLAGERGEGPDPAEFRLALRRFYYDIALPTSPNAIRTLAEVADPRRILFGTDWPGRETSQVGQVVRAYNRDEAVAGRLRRGIDRENALALLPGVRARVASFG